VSLPFVRVAGGSLRLGDRPHRFVGVNRYDLLSSARYRCGRHYDDSELARLLSEIAGTGATVLRTWVFSGFTDGGRDFSTLDRLIEGARRHDLRLVLTLENQWRDCSVADPSTADGRKGPAWFAGGWRDSLRPYLEAIGSRYRAEPQILAWQLMNEAESTDADALLGFAEEASALLKAVDPDHLVSLGTIGAGQAGTTGARYKKLHALPTIDLVEAHDYHHDEDPLPRSIADDLAVAWALGKPFFVGEAGIAAPPCSSIQRAARFEEKIRAAFDAGASGYLVWSFYDLSTPTGWDFGPDDPLATVLARTARALLSS
jgi:endo-1,4-beta-mannosidase